MKKLKKLNELGISPVPWTNRIQTEKPFEINHVWDACNGMVLSGGYRESIADARLTAAAPDLYETLLEALPWLADIGAEVVGNEAAAEINAIVKKAETALAKASENLKSDQEIDN